MFITLSFVTNAPHSLILFLSLHLTTLNPYHNVKHLFFQTHTSLYTHTIYLCLYSNGTFMAFIYKYYKLGVATLHHAFIMFCVMNTDILLKLTFNFIVQRQWNIWIVEEKVNNFLEASLLFWITRLLLFRLFCINNISQNKGKTLIKITE